ncbi:PREDICTED: uncharacterized protein LOC104733882 [Camelina sativa]|uniref:Uncharacterized protein LOC104733882 n=1 Tax=Camelina sativa TaxID=90675 RepID=A0ABM1QRX4_CAMSA|nr:PREDICTED: uncharacterized protein LOC104733882 [Camelina sativa]
MDFLKLDEEAPLQTGNPDVRFYWQIMTPRLDWPSFDYGWLKDFHMGAAMKMFRNRFICDPSQYPNQRIAFLDQDMLSSLLRDFDQFALSRRNFLFRDMYLEHYNGLAPVDSQTKKKWYVDVDHIRLPFCQQKSLGGSGY